MEIKCCVCDELITVPDELIGYATSDELYICDACESIREEEVTLDEVLGE